MEPKSTTKNLWIPVQSFKDVPSDGLSKLVVIEGSERPQLLWYAGYHNNIPVVGGCFVHSFVQAPKVTHYLNIEMP